jgi:glycosyltransferase involved in cell wall biosynthesis
VTEAIDSILNQTYKNFEIIVIDDGSTDNTKEALGKYISGKLIRYYYQDNRGIAAARNRGIREAKEDHIAFLDADDKWLPQRLEKTVGFLESNSYDWVCSSFYRVEGETRKTEIRRLDKQSLLENSCLINMLKDGLFYFSSKNISTVTILVKRKCFEKIGFFDEKFRTGEDMDMWLRFEEAGLKGGYLDTPLAYYMVRKDGITKSSEGNLVNLKLAIKHAKILGLDNIKIRKSLGEIYFKYADIYFNEQNEFLKAFYFVLKGLYYNPQIKKIYKGIRIIVRKKKWGKI